jgi:hypothetical protein
VRWRRLEFWLGLWTLLFVAATAALVFFGSAGNADKGDKRAFVLKVADQNGRMRVDWDASMNLIRTAQGATLEVEDGGTLNRYPVEPRILRAGGLDYIRRSDDVLLTLTLFHNGRANAQASVRAVGAIPKPPVVEPDRAASERRQTSRARRR